MKPIFCLLFFFALTHINATNISGGLYNNTQFTKSGSPYILTGNVVLFPNKTLTIDPGVEVRFDNNVSLEIRGKLIAKGSVLDTIRFTSNTGTTKGSYAGINILNTQGGSAIFQYCKFSYANSAIREECCFGGRDTVLNSVFTSNNQALSGYTGNDFIVDSCLFEYNDFTITEGDKLITNSIFRNNKMGLAGTERVSVKKSTFKNNDIALMGARGLISECIIENNKVGVSSTYEGFKIFKSSISNNDTGIIAARYNQGMDDIDSSKICHNSTYNFINLGDKNLDLYTNCFCNKDSTAIENKIYDGYDDNKKGLVSYDIFNNACDTFVKKENKSAHRLIHWTKPNSPYILTRDFVLFPNWTLLIDPGVEVRFDNNVSLKIRGKLIAKGAVLDTIRFTSNTGTVKGSYAGINILNTQGGSAIFQYCKFSYANSAIREECCFGGRDTVLNSVFTSNNQALSGYTGNDFIVDSCLFEYNDFTITEGDKLITNSIFRNNKMGLAGTERVSVKKSTFKNNDIALMGARGLISECIIENNKVGVSSTYEGFKIFKSSISNNDTGIIAARYNQGMDDIDSSKICHNNTYNFINLGDKNLDLYTNCFCNKDSTTVENKIYDGFDDITRGLVDYELYTNNCDTLIFRTHKLSRTVTYFNITSSIKTDKNVGIILYPNPVSNILYIQSDLKFSSIDIYNSFGQIVINSGSANQIDLTLLPEGIYFVQISDKYETIAKSKIIVSHK